LAARITGWLGSAGEHVPEAGHHALRKLVADAPRLERSEHGGRLGDRPFRGEGELGLGPVGGELLLDLRPLFGSPHRRISIMAGR